MTPMSELVPNKQLCEQAIEGLMSSSEPVSSVLLAYRDGRPFVLKSKAKPNAEKFSAMASSLGALSTSILRELGGDKNELTLIEGVQSKLILVSIPTANHLLLLAVHAELGANLGRLLTYTKACANTVAGSFQPRASVSHL